MNGHHAKKEKKKRSKKTELYHHLQHLIDGFNLTQWPDFGRKFHAFTDPKGIRSFIEEDDAKVCRYVAEDAIIHAIMHYCSRNLPNIAEALITKQEARTCFGIWEGLTPNFTEEIRPVSEKSEDCLCWHRLEFDLEDVNTEVTPAFNEMFSRITNGEALKAWIGSLLQDDSDRQQYVWIYGEGNNGKGALARFLQKVMGPAYTSQLPPNPGDRFWTSGLLGARLVVFPDCTDANFPTTGLFKSLTGGDAQKIEEKGKQPYTADLFCKMMFLSNEKPNIKGGKADKRRAIYCEMQPITTKPMPSKIYDDILWAEAPYFLAECKALYEKMCPDHGAIAVDPAALDELIEANEEDFRCIFEKFFEQVNIDPTAHKNKLPFVAPVRMQSILDENKFSFKAKREFQDFMKRLGVSKIHIKDANGRTAWRYIGLREKNAAEKEREDITRERF